jgi:ADP-dependent glucokinase
MLNQRLLAFIFLGLSFLVGYFYHQVSTSSSGDSIVEQVYFGLVSAGTKTPKCQNTRVAVGYNANLDLIADAIDVFQAAGVSPSVGKDHEKIATLQELGETFSLYFEKGAAAERFVTDKVLFDNIVK